MLPAESPPPHTYFRNRDGSWPLSTVSVERIRDITRDEFERRFVRTCTPVILERFISDDCLLAADPERLRREHGDTPLEVLFDIPDKFLWEFPPENRRTTTLADFASWLESPLRVRPAYANQISIDCFPSLPNTLTFSELIPDLCPQSIWFGSADSNIGLHFDPADSYLGQLWGRKVFFFFPFEVSGKLYPFSDDLTRSQVDLRSFDLREFPNLASVSPYIGEIGPGDLVYVPRYTWHYFWATMTSISASTFHNSEITARRVVRLLRMYGAHYSLGVIEQMLRYGAFGRPYIQRGYGWPPAGLILWKMMTGKLGRW